MNRSVQILNEFGDFSNVNCGNTSRFKLIYKILHNETFWNPLLRNFSQRFWKHVILSYNSRLKGTCGNVNAYLSLRFT